MFPIVLVIINDVVPILSRIVPERSYSRWLTRYLKIFFSLSLSSISLSTGNAPSCREICQKRKSFKMTVLQHELQYLVISFQQASVTSIELSERGKLTKHAFSSLTSGDFFFRVPLTTSVLRSCEVLVFLRIKEIPMHRSASLSFLPFRFLVVGSVYIHWIFILGAKRIYKGDQQRVSQRHATAVHVKEP